MKKLRFLVIIKVKSDISGIEWKIIYKMNIIYFDKNIYFFNFKISIYII